MGRLLLFQRLSAKFATISNRRLLLLTGLCLAGCLSIRARECSPSQLRVLVKDSQESPIFDASVTATSNGKSSQEQSTGSLGVADFESLPCGSWSVRASKDGFDEATGSIEMTDHASGVVTLVLNPRTQHSSIEVKETPPAVEQSASENNELAPQEVKPLPGNPATISDTLPLTPGVVRSPDGELKLDGSGEQRSALVVNQSDVTDPATGKFGQTVPVDAIQTVNVLSTPFLAQYGRFTQTVVAVETRRGGEKWHAELNDPFPDFRIRSYHMRGIRNETPRGVVGGPLIRDKLYFNSALVYYLDKVPNRTLGFPYNESKQEWLNSYTQVDYIASAKQIINATLHVTPQHINFVNPDYFNPQPVSPSYAQHNYMGTVADHYGLWGGTLDSSLSIQRFVAYVGAQGPSGMVLNPGGNSGNYFATQNREAKRTEWLELWSPSPLRLGGSHQVKIGNSLTNSDDQGTYSFRPVSLLNQSRQLVQRIDFANKPPFNRTDLEVTAYAQDHWAVTQKLSFDYGARIEHQKLASSLRIAPRVGAAWSPFRNEKTVFRAGWGQFYDHIPLDVYGFGRYPQRTITNFAPDGGVIGTPQQFVNVIGSVNGYTSFLVHGKIVAGNFSPRGATWNVQFEHGFSNLFRFRAVYLNNRSVDLIMLEPAFSGTTPEVVLNGNGVSRYRQLELTGKIHVKDLQLNLTYTHSRAEGSLNEFDNFVGNYPAPIVRPDYYSNLPGDLPNRFLVWGHVDTHIWSLQMFPIIEYRNGFPYARYDAFQEYVGTPYSDATRFPNFFSADTRLMRDFRVNPKYTLRLSLTGFNLTNHFNALAVHGNVADPLAGVFFGNYKRHCRFDFEVVF